MSTEPEYIVVQPGLDGVAWLGEIIDGEPTPIAKIDNILRDASVLAAVAALVDEWDEADGNGLDAAVQSIRLEVVVNSLRATLANGTESTGTNRDSCRTCGRPITFETVEEPGRLPRTGWSDGDTRDPLICFRALNYAHVPVGQDGADK